MNHFGEQLRKLRKTRGITLPALAVAASVTKGYLSKIEHAESPPTFSTLQALANALGVEVTELLETRNEKKTPLSANLEIHDSKLEDWQRAAQPGGYAFKPLLESYRQKYLSPFIMEIEPGTTSYFKHDGEEFLFVLEGTLELEYEGKKHPLGQGVSAYLDSRLKHRFHNPTRKPAKLVAVNFVYRRF